MHMPLWLQTASQSTGGPDIFTICGVISLLMLGLLMAYGMWLRPFSSQEPKRELVNTQEHPLPLPTE